MQLRLLVTAFIKKDDKLLMIHRSEKKEIAPGLWSGPGGHIEPDEIDCPEKACYREIHEETGLSEKDIKNFKLKCIVLRNKDDFELRQQFVYFGETKNDIDHTTDEGELHWIPENELLNLSMTKTCRHILSAYLSGKFSNDDIYIGISAIKQNKDNLVWIKIDDFDRHDTFKNI